MTVMMMIMIQHSHVGRDFGLATLKLRRFVLTSMNSTFVATIKSFSLSLKSVAKFKFYAVKCGRDVGIYSTWDEIVPLVNGYPGAVYKGFKTYEVAQSWMCGPMPKWGKRKHGEKKPFKYASMKSGQVYKTTYPTDPNFKAYRGEEPPWNIQTEKHCRVRYKF